MRKSESDAIKFGTLTDNANFIELDCPHYAHDYKYEEISNEMKKFIMANWD